MWHAPEVLGFMHGLHHVRCIVHDLLRDTSDIDTSATILVAFDDGYRGTVPSSSLGAAETTTSASDDNQIKVFLVLGRVAERGREADTGGGQDGQSGESKGRA